MSDFKLIIDKVLELLSIEIPVLGFHFTIFSLFLSFTILSIVIGFVVKIFGGD